MPSESLPRNSSLQQGTYVVFQLNTLATMWPLGPSAQALANKLTTQKYVAFVGEVVHLGEHDACHATTQCELHLVGTGMPKPHPCHVTDEAMSVPLFPATERPRSESPPRQPLVPSPLLPPQWTSCYQHTLLTCTVRVKDVNCENAWGSKLSTENALHHYRYSWEDRQREARLFVAEMRRLQEPIIPEPVPEGISENADDESDQICAEDNSRLTDVLRASYSQIPSDSSRMLAEITVDVWLDLGIVPEPPEPRGFFDELQTLWSIELSSRPKHVHRDEILYLEPEGNFTR